MELLLFIIKDRIGAAFLSDLHLSDNRLAVDKVLCALTPEDYSLREWQDALLYITGEKHEFESLDELRQYLRQLAIKIHG